MSAASTAISVPPPGFTSISSPRPNPSTARVICTSGRLNERAIAIAIRIAHRIAAAPPISVELLTALPTLVSNVVGSRLDHRDQRPAGEPHPFPAESVALAVAPVITCAFGASLAVSMAAKSGKSSWMRWRSPRSKPNSLDAIRVDQIVAGFVDEVDFAAAVDVGANPRQRRAQVEIDHQHGERLPSLP